MLSLLMDGPKNVRALPNHVSAKLHFCAFFLQETAEKTKKMSTKEM